MSAECPEEWVTVTEAAERLRIQERQARRLAGKLPPEERTPEGVRPAKLRWCPDNVRRMGGIVQIGPDKSVETVEIAADIAPIGADQTPPDVSEASEMSGEMSEQSAALIEQLRATIADKDLQIANLWAMIERRDSLEMMNLQRAQERQALGPIRTWWQRMTLLIRKADD